MAMISYDVLCSTWSEFSQKSVYRRMRSPVRHGRSQRGGGGTGGPDPLPPPPPPPPPPWNCQVIIFAMLKFSVTPLLGIWTLPHPPEKIFWIRACPDSIRNACNIYQLKKLSVLKKRLNIETGNGFD